MLLQVSSCDRHWGDVLPMMRLTILCEFYHPHARSTIGICLTICNLVGFNRLVVCPKRRCKWM